MKKPFLPLFLLLICLSLVAFQCEDDDTPATQETERAELNILKSDIETLANTSVCNESTECKYLAFGNKPCGGPWSYLIYSTSIDEEKLQDLVKEYNEKESAFNAKWGVFSDCAFVSPPSSVKCENNTCVAIY
tara:strand:- start:13088 stop:13486 length:399 start_codon:yes stop_codon:yes gene_type:complete